MSDYPTWVWVFDCPTWVWVMIALIAEVVCITAFLSDTDRS